MGKIQQIIQYARGIRSEHGIGLFTQFAEILYLYISRRLGPRLYYSARLWRRDMPMRDKQDYLNGAQYQACLDRLNPVQYRKLYQHKLAEKSLLVMMGFPTAKFLGFYQQETGRDASGRLLRTPDSLESLLATCDTDVVCFKLPEGWGGRGFTAAKVDRSDHVPRLENLAFPGDGLPVADFFDKYLVGYADGGLLIEEYIRQHEVLAAFHGSSINTLRILVIQRGGGVEVLGVLLRIGRRGAVVDNTEQGGLIAELDPETGMITTLRSIGVIPEYYERHPDTGVEVGGVQLPHWPACIDLSKKVLLALPHLNYAGIDVAIGPDGPVILELNPQPDLAGSRVFRSPPARLLA